VSALKPCRPINTMSWGISMHEEIEEENRKASLSRAEIECLLQSDVKRNIPWGFIYDVTVLLALVLLLVLSQTTVCNS